MIFTAIDTFYITDEQLSNSPSRKDGIDHHTETNLRFYGCDIIQESGILLRLSQAGTATAQVLFHRFYCKKSFARFDVKIVAASCVWLSSKLEETPRTARQVLLLFHRMERRKEGVELEQVLFDVDSRRYKGLKGSLVRAERHLLREMGFICHVEHPHKFMLSYLATLEQLSELRQVAWNLANDSLRTTLCVRFKSEVVACGVIYAAARRFKVPLPENPPWWEAFDAKKCQIDEVCRVLAQLYTLPKAQFIPMCKEGPSFTSNKLSYDSQSQQVHNSASQSCTPAEIDVITRKSAPPGVNIEPAGSKVALIKEVDKLKEAMKGDDAPNSMSVDKEVRKEGVPKSRFEHKTESRVDRIKETGRERDRNRLKVSDRGRSWDSDRDRGRKLSERGRHIFKDRSNHTNDRGNRSGVPYLEKSRRQSSRDRDHHGSLDSSREKDRHRYHSPA